MMQDISDVVEAIFKEFGIEESDMRNVLDYLSDQNPDMFMCWINENVDVTVDKDTDNEDIDVEDVNVTTKIEWV